LKRIRRVYKDRYKIDFDPIRIELLQAKDTHTRDVFNMYKVQLDRLYYSICRRLLKEWPIEYVRAFLNESYQTFYPMSFGLLESTNYRLPEWEEFTLKYYDPTYHHHKSIEQAYEMRYNVVFQVEESLYDINERLLPYRTVVRHDPRTAPKFPKPVAISVQNLDIHVLLSYFDDIQGPIAGVIAPPPHGGLEKKQLEAIPRLMDMIGAAPGEPFIHSSSNYGSINLIFSVPMPVRGGQRDYMLSVVINPVEIREMVKISQMRDQIEKTTKEIKLVYINNPDLATTDKILSSEPEKIALELLDYIKMALKGDQ
ncbi:MAG: hypothetical protein ACXAE3_13715, partial [Candidatus Kariarchaeaceae archaeon]